MSYDFKIILKSLILCICEGILKSFERQECNSHTDFCKYICSVAGCRNEWLCVYIYMLNAVSTSVVANIFLHMRLCIIRRKCLPFDWQFSKKSSPKREKQSLHCTVSNQLVRRVHLAGMLYLYLLFSKVLSVACLEAMWKGIIKAILIFKIEFAYLISLPKSFYLALNSSNTCKVFPLWTSACLETSSGWKAVCGRGIILQDNEENALMNRAWWQQCGGLYWSISEERQHMWQDFKGAPSSI